MIPHREPSMLIGVKKLLRPAPRRGSPSRRRRWVDHGAIPMLNQLAIAHPEGVEREHLVERSGGRRGVLSIVPVDDRHEITFGHHDLERIPRRRLRTRRRWCWCLATASAAARTSLPRTTESRLEVLIVAEPC